MVDHDSGRLARAAPGREKQTVHAFFDAPGPHRSAALTHVSADGADWTADAVTQRAPAAVLCADPFHVVSRATDALDEVRREAWRAARAAGQHTPTRKGSRTVGIATDSARSLKRARYTLWKNPAGYLESTIGQYAKTIKARVR